MAMRNLFLSLYENWGYDLIKVTPPIAYVLICNINMLLRQQHPLQQASLDLQGLSRKWCDSSLL